MPVKENDRMNLDIVIVQTQPTTQLVSANAVGEVIVGVSTNLELSVDEMSFQGLRGDDI